MPSTVQTCLSLSFGLHSPLPAAQVGEGFLQLRQDVRRGHRNIVRADNDFHLWRECRESLDGFGISCKIGLWPVQPDRGRVIGNLQ